MKMAAVLAARLRATHVLSFEELLRQVGEIRLVYQEDEESVVVASIQMTIREIRSRINYQPFDRNNPLFAPNLDKLQELWLALRYMKSDVELDQFFRGRLDVVNAEFNYHLEEQLGREGEEAFIQHFMTEKTLIRMNFLVDVFYPYAHAENEFRNVLYEGPLPRAEHPKDEENIILLHHIRHYGSYLAQFLKHPQFGRGQKEPMLRNMKVLWDKQLALDLLFDAFMDVNGRYEPWLREEILRSAQNRRLIFPFEAAASHPDEEEFEYEDFDASKIWHEITYGGDILARLLMGALLNTIHMERLQIKAGAGLLIGLVNAVIARIERNGGAEEDIRMVLDFNIADIKFRSTQKPLQRLLYGRHMDKVRKLDGNERRALFEYAFMKQAIDKQGLMECVLMYVTNGGDLNEVGNLLNDYAVLIQRHRFAGQPQHEYWKVLLRIIYAVRRNEWIFNLVVAFSDDHEAFLAYYKEEIARHEGLFLALSFSPLSPVASNVVKMLRPSTH
jgi:hypothetical protein